VIGEEEDNEESSRLLNSYKRTCNNYFVSL